MRSTADRPLRPLFPKGFYNDVQVVATCMSMDHDCAPEFCAMVGSSIAIAISDIPWDGPTGSVVVGRVDGRLVVNPTQAERQVSDIFYFASALPEGKEAGARERSPSASEA